MTKVTRNEFRAEFKSGIDTKNQETLDKLQQAGVNGKKLLEGADSNSDGRIEGRELSKLFNRIDDFDRNGSRSSVSGRKPLAIIGALRDTQKPAAAPTAPPTSETALDEARRALYDAEGGGITGNELDDARGRIAGRYGADVADRVMKESLGLKLDKLDASGVDWVQRHLGTRDQAIDRYQQALGTHLKDARLIDANFDGKLDAGDKIWTKGADGRVNVKNIEPALLDRVKIGGAMIGAAEAMGAAKHQFALIKDHSFNERFWAPTGSGTFALKPGVKASEAFDDIFKNPSKYRFECATGLVITQYKAMRDLLGKDDFDRVCSDLRLGPWQMERTLEQHTNITGSGEHEASAERQASLRAGDYGYFRNWDVSDGGRERGWQGENVIFLGEKNGERMFFGHPFGIASEKTIVDHLNGERNAGSTRSASFLDLRSELTSDVLAHDRVRGD
jgi:protein-glutamine gamma-glutamyltransferase